MAATEKAPGQRRTLWGGLTSGQRIGFLGSAIFVAVGLVALGAWFSIAEYSVLFGNLAPEDAAEIVETLQTDNVPYRLTAGGSVVQVPADKVFEARLKLAAQGIPQSGEVGYDIFDELTYDRTDFAQRMNYTRALETELTRTVRKLNKVEGARVHLVLPEKTISGEDQPPATASVVLKMHSNSALTNKQARGIAFLVASSVEGLTPANVTIVDVGGNVLHRDVGVGSAPLASNQFEHKNNFELQTEKRIRAMIERVFGVGIAIVRVSARFNFDQVERTAEVYDPDNVVVKSEEHSTEGAAGARSSRKTEKVSYEVARTVTRTVKATGQLEQLNIDVVVDGTYQEDAESGEKTFIPRSPEELGQIGAMVGKVAGVDPRRGDQVEVTSIPFKPDESMELLEPGLGTGFYLALVKYGIGLIALLFFFSLVFRPFLNLLGGGKGSAPGPGDITTPVSLERLEREMGLGVDEAAEGGGYPGEATMPKEVEKRDALKKQIIEQIKEEPAAAANLIRSWVAD